MDDIIDSMDMSLSKLQEVVMDRDVVVWYFKQTLFFFLLLMEEEDGIDLLKSTDWGEKKGWREIIILRSKWFLITELRIYPSL